jgi:hypothetical protein
MITYQGLGVFPVQLQLSITYTVKTNLFVYEHMLQLVFFRGAYCEGVVATGFCVPFFPLLIKIETAIWLPSIWNTVLHHESSFSPFFAEVSVSFSVATGIFQSTKIHLIKIILTLVLDSYKIQPICCTTFCLATNSLNC